jgi:Holliday junction DNA helicase RuvA
MISYLKGNIITKLEKTIILLVGGVGYQIYLAPVLLEKAKSGQDAEFFIHPHIKEDAWDLYGFETAKELTFFKLLLSVSGIGPKSALNVISGAKVEDIQRAILSEDESLLHKITGVSSKAAEKIILELKNKINKVDLSPVKSDSAQTDENLGDWQTIEALIALGYNEFQVRTAVKKIPAKIENVNERVKEGLKILGRK